MLFRSDEDVDFRLQLDKNIRSNLNELAKMHIANAKGKLIELGKFASFNQGQASSDKYHYNGKNSITITADIDEKQMRIYQANQQVIKQLDLAQNWPQVKLQTGGENQETTDSLASLASNFIIAIIAIYFVLMILFNSALQPLMIISAIPFGVIGVIFAFYLHNQPFTFMAMLGIIGMSGVVVNDSLVLVKHINNKRKQHAFSLELLASGVTERLRAVLLTSFTTIAGVMPLAYAWGGSDAMLESMALALGYGLLFSSLLTLWLLPCIYMLGIDISNYISKLNIKL